MYHLYLLYQDSRKYGSDLLINIWNMLFFCRVTQIDGIILSLDLNI